MQAVLPRTPHCASMDAGVKVVSSVSSRAVPSFNYYHRQSSARAKRLHCHITLLDTMNIALPAVLEPHRTYLDRANELAGPHPLVALQCRLMCLQLAMVARSERRDLSELAACELRQWVVTTLEECEAVRARLGATAADPEAALAALRSLGFELIGRARPLRHNPSPNPRPISRTLASAVALTPTPEQASHSDRPDAHPSAALPWTVHLTLTLTLTLTLSAALFSSIPRGGRRAEPATRAMAHDGRSPHPGQVQEAPLVAAAYHAGAVLL